MAPSQIDRRGYAYTDLLMVQDSHMALLEPWLTSARFAALEQYLQRTNRAAASPEELHRVYRGNDLYVIMQKWPDLEPAYLPIDPKKSDNLDDVV